jgi:hypothetical protein
MKFLKNITGRFSILKEFFVFLGERKKWWLLPIVIMLLLLALLMVLSQNAPLAPFIYTMF